jgi:hypothetical protein
MFVRDLIEKLDSDLDYIELTSNNESLGSFTLDDENYDYIKKYLDREIKTINFRTYDDYDENMDGEMYSLYTNKVLEIEIWDESQYGKF